MNLKISEAILGATRLVRGGHLAEATHAIQRALQGRHGPAPASHGPQSPPHDGDVIEGLFRVVDSSPPAKARSQFATRSFMNAAGTRQYKVYLPARHSAQGLPVVVMLHGCQQGPDDFAAATRMNALAEEHGLVVVYPKQTVKANKSNCWNWFESRHQQREAGEPSIIAGITREVVAAYGADADRVYVAGLSAGGAMAAVMATTYPDVYAAVGIHSGLAYASAHDIPSAFNAMRGDGLARLTPASGASGTRVVPTIVFHGDRDATVHPSNGDELIADAAKVARPAAGADSESAPRHSVEQGEASGRTYTRSVYRTERGDTVIEHWLVHGAAHAWSGGSAEGSYSDPAGPDASREMLRFFLQHKN